MEARLKRCKMLGYAAQFCGHHLRSSPDPKGELDDLLGKLLRNDRWLEMIMRVIISVERGRDRQSMHWPDDSGPANLYAVWVPYDLLAAFPDQGADINQQDSDGFACLHLAAKSGNTRSMALLLERGAIVGDWNDRHESAAHWAARNGHKGAVDLLISQGAVFWQDDSDISCGLKWAVINQHRDCVKAILDRMRFGKCGRDFNAMWNTLEETLLLAIKLGDSSVVEMLLDGGANINFTDSSKSTALDWAVAEGQVATVQVLLERGADPTSRDIYDNTPLHWAVPFPPILRALLQRGVDVRAKNHAKHTPLHWSAQGGNHISAEALLAAAVEINAQDKYGCTALHAAALCNHPTIVHLLLQHGADPNILDIDRWTPLDAALVGGHTEVVDLLDCKTDVDIGAGFIATPEHANAEQVALLQHQASIKSMGNMAVRRLCEAAQEGQLSEMQLFLEAGDNIDAHDPCGSTALTVAATRHQDEALLFLLDRGANVNLPELGGMTALHLAADTECLGHTRTAAILVEKGADIEARVHSFSPLLFAAQRCNLALVDLLLSHQVDVRVSDYFGRTPLHFIANSWGCETAMTLIERGANVNAADRVGRTPLMWSASTETSCRAMSDILLENGADCHAVAGDGASALHYAAFADNSQLVKELLRRGVPIDSVTNAGFTALHCAFLMGRRGIVKMLRRKGASTSETTCPTVLRSAVLESEVAVGTKRSAIFAMGARASAILTMDEDHPLLVLCSQHDTTKIEGADPAYSGTVPPLRSLDEDLQQRLVELSRRW